VLIAILTDQRHARCLDLDLSVNLLMDSGCPLRSPSKKDEDRQPDARERALCVRQRYEKAIKLDQASDLFSGSGSTSSMSSGCDTHRIYSKLADRATGCHRDIELGLVTSDLTEEIRVVSRASKESRFSGSTLFGT
jgi:hypothetical protein